MVRLGYVRLGYDTITKYLSNAIADHINQIPNLFHKTYVI